MKTSFKQFEENKPPIFWMKMGHVDKTTELRQVTHFNRFGSNDYVTIIVTFSATLVLSRYI